MQGKES